MAVATATRAPAPVARPARSSASSGQRSSSRALPRSAPPVIRFDPNERPPVPFRPANSSRRSVAPRRSETGPVTAPAPDAANLSSSAAPRPPAKIAGAPPGAVQIPGGGTTQAASLGKIAAAPLSPVQAQVLAQAELINNDCARSESQVSRIGAARKQLVGAQFSAVRQGLSAFVTSSITGIQAFIAGKQAEITAAATRTLASVRTAISGALQTARALGTQIRARIDGMIEGATTAVQGRVEEIAGQITGVIDSVSLPDIPGIATIRAAAVNVLNRAAIVVSGAFGHLMGFVRYVFDAGMSLLDSLLGAVASVVDWAMGVITSAIQTALQFIGQALNAAVGAIGSILRASLLGVIGPILNAIESGVVKIIGVAEQRSLGLLRANRNHYLSALAEAVTPGAAAPGPQAASAENGTAVLQLLGRDALENNARIVQTLELTIGRNIATLIGLLASAAARIMAGLVGGLAQARQTIVTAVTQAVQFLARLAEAISNFVRQLIEDFRAALEDLIESVISAVEGGVNRLLEFARGGLSRITGFVSRFVQNLVFGGSGSGSATEAVGEFSLAYLVGPAKGPIVIPRPGPITIPGLVFTFVYVLAVVGAAAIFLVPALMGVVVYLVSLGVPPLVAFAIVGLLALLLLALLLLLLWLTLRWLLRRRPRPPRKRVIRVTPSVLELGVGGRIITSTATIAPGTPPSPPLTWTINPAGTAGVSVTGRGRRVGVRADHPPHGTVVGGTPITVRAALTADPTDFADSPDVMMIQVLDAAYAAAPALVPVPITTPGFPTPAVPPPNSAEPNRDGIAGNTAQVNATTAPAGRPIGVALRRPVGATAAGTTITPGRATGDVGVRITDTATTARLDETLPATAGPAALMADMTINAVPTAVSMLGFLGRDALGPYSAINAITFSSSDPLHLPRTRIVGELITGVADDFNVQPPNGAFNPVFRLDLAVPENSWNDLLFLSAGELNTVDRRAAVDVNRFVGPGAPGLPRRLIYRQRFQYSSWQGAGTVISRTIADGQHIKLLIGRPPAAFQFKIEHRFGGVASTPPAENYVGPPLIILSNVVATPNAPGATALAADNVATAALGVTSSAPGRTVNWTIRSGDISITGGNPAVLPATATLKAGVRAGNFGVRAADTIFTVNRFVDGNVGVVAVALQNMRATPNPVPAGTASATVSLNANPGGRTVNWSLDAASVAAGVTVTPASTGPGAPAMTVTVTRPSGFTGSTVVTATDSVLTARTNRLRIIFN